MLYLDVNLAMESKKIPNLSALNDLFNIADSKFPSVYSSHTS